MSLLDCIKERLQILFSKIEKQKNNRYRESELRERELNIKLRDSKNIEN